MTYLLIFLAYAVVLSAVLARAGRAGRRDRRLDPETPHRLLLVPRPPPRQTSGFGVAG